MSEKHTFPESQALIDAGAKSFFDPDNSEALADDPDCPECGFDRRCLTLRDDKGKLHAFALCDNCGHEEAF